MIINDTCVHDVDVARFLLDDEIVAARVLTARKNSLASDHLTDPVLFIFEMAGGALVDVEASINIQYAYDIRGEVVGESGTVELAETNPVVVKKARPVRRARARGLAGAVHPSLRHRVPGVDQRRAPKGESTGPSARGTATPPPSSATAGLKAMQSGERVEISLREQPDLYNDDHPRPDGTD